MVQDCEILFNVNGDSTFNDLANEKAGKLTVAVVRYAIQCWK